MKDQDVPKSSLGSTISPTKLKKENHEPEPKPKRRWYPKIRHWSDAARIVEGHGFLRNASNLLIQHRQSLGSAHAPLDARWAHLYTVAPKLGKLTKGLQRPAEFNENAKCLLKDVEKQVKEAHRQSGGAVSIFSLIRLGSTAGSIRPRKQTNRGKKALSSVAPSSFSVMPAHPGLMHNISSRYPKELRPKFGGSSVISILTEQPPPSQMSFTPQSHHVPLHRPRRERAPPQTSRLRHEFSPAESSARIPLATVQEHPPIPYTDITNTHVYDDQHHHEYPLVPPRLVDSSPPREQQSAYPRERPPREQRPPREYDRRDRDRDRERDRDRDERSRRHREHDSKSTSSPDDTKQRDRDRHRDHDDYPRSRRHYEDDSRRHRDDYHRRRRDHDRDRDPPRVRRHITPDDDNRRGRSSREYDSAEGPPIIRIQKPTPSPDEARRRSSHRHDYHSRRGDTPPRSYRRHRERSRSRHRR